MALKKQATPKCWRSKEAKEIVVAVQPGGWTSGTHRQRASEGHLIITVFSKVATSRSFLSTPSA